MKPLTEAQEGMWYAQRLDPANPVFNTGQYIEIHGPLELEAFRCAVNQVMDEADSLAVRFVDMGTTPKQCFDATRRARLELVDLRSAANPSMLARERMQDDMAMPRQLEGDALVRQQLFVVAPHHHIWYQRIHHILTDGYGMALIEQRVAQCYMAFLHGGEKAQALSAYAEVLAEDQAYRSSSQREQDRVFWHTLFSQAQPAQGLVAGPAVSAHYYHSLQVALPEQLEPQLQVLAQQSGVAWPDILVALSAAYLSRHLAASTTIIGVPWMGRFGHASARVPAMVMNVLPLPVQVDEEAVFEHFLVAVAKQLRSARRHGRYRSEQLRRDLGFLGGDKRLFGALINVLPFEAALQLPGLTTKRHILGTGPVDDLNLTFRAAHDGSGLCLDVDANPQLYSPENIVAHGRRLGHFLSRALEADRLSSVATLDALETRRWTIEVNQTAHAVPETTLWALIAVHLHARATETAIIHEHGALSYGELDALTAALALRLSQEGVKRGDIVAVALPRSLDLMVALLSILRVGAAYLPLDFQHPPARIAQVLGACNATMVLSSTSAQHCLPQRCPKKYLIDQGEDAALTPPQLALARQLPAAGPFDAAYVIFTSGSTGMPKGVVIEHDAIVNRLLWMQAHYGIGQDERILQKTPVTFDVSVWEIFLPLISGATQVVAPAEAHRDPAWLARIIKQQQITTLHFVPSMLAAFIAEPTTQGLVMKRVFCSGEALPASLRDQFHQRFNCELHNLYGPTEAAVDVSYWPAHDADLSQPLPIGFPVWNTGLFILDEQLRPVPPGVSGRLYLAGRQLARSYLGRPDFTAERFISNPFAHLGKRMYDTGDLACWREDGAAVYLGRNDHQIKLRGQRIELGEIEAVLALAPEVLHAVVLLHGQPGDEHYLVAYLVLANGYESLNEAALRQHAATYLPDYMLPVFYLTLPALPVTSNGKLDRAALPAPQFSRSIRGQMAQTVTEKRLVALFAQVLNWRPGVSAASIGVEDDFFALGGHSLLAAQLATLIRAEWHCFLGLGAVFEYPSIGRLAAHIDSLVAQEGSVSANEAGFGAILQLCKGSIALPPLFWVHPAGGLSWCYGVLSRSLVPARDVYGLQAQAFSGQPQPDSLEEMASNYVDIILTQQHASPFHLAGWSVGGIIAQAMAVELCRRGLQVGLLAMLDAYPSDCWRDQPVPPPEAVFKALLHIAGHDPHLLPDVSLTQEGVTAFLRSIDHPLASLPATMLAAVIETVANSNRLVREHRHQYYDGPLLYFRAGLDHVGENLVPQQWAPYVAQIEVHELAALHAHLTGVDASGQIAPVIQESLHRYENRT